MLLLLLLLARPANCLAVNKLCELNWFACLLRLHSFASAKAKVATCRRATMPKAWDAVAKVAFALQLQLAACAQMLSNWVNDTSTWLKSQQQQERERDREKKSKTKWNRVKRKKIHFHSTHTHKASVALATCNIESENCNYKVVIVADTDTSARYLQL